MECHPRKPARGDFLVNGLELLRQVNPGNPVLAWFNRNPLAAESWQEQAPDPAVLRLPLLLPQGWHDPYLRGGLDIWKLSKQAGGNPLLRIGPWSHLSWDRRVGSVDQGPHACGGVDEWQLAFLISTCAIAYRLRKQFPAWFLIYSPRFGNKGIQRGPAIKPGA
ncbi:CocE/NonD family hydrolase [Synechococcus lacustris Tous-12m]